MIYIIDDIGKVVQALRTGQYDTYHSDQYDKAGLPIYMPGHRNEISDRLTEMSQHPQQKKKKFPLIALNTMNITPTVRGVMWDFNLNIVIGTSVDNNLSTEERDAQIFKPILYPLYDRFITAFINSGLFVWDGTQPQSSPPHTPMIKHFWGIETKEGSVKNIFNEYMCAIELVNLKVSRQNFNC